MMTLEIGDTTRTIICNDYLVFLLVLNVYSFFVPFAKEERGNFNLLIIVGTRHKLVFPESTRILLCHEMCTPALTAHKSCTHL